MWVAFAREFGWTIDYSASLDHARQMLVYVELMDNLRAEAGRVTRFKHPRTGRETLRFADPAEASRYIAEARRRAK